MRARPLAATLRRLDRVDATLFGDDGERRGGVLCVPAIESDLNAWERRAMRQQAELRTSAAEDVGSAYLQPYRDPLPGPLTPQIEGVHFHRPDPYRDQAPRPLPAKRPPLPPGGMIR